MLRIPITDKADVWGHAVALLELYCGRCLAEALLPTVCPFLKRDSLLALKNCSSVPIPFQALYRGARQLPELAVHGSCLSNLPWSHSICSDIG